MPAFISISIFLLIAAVVGITQFVSTPTPGDSAEYATLARTVALAYQQKSQMTALPCEGTECVAAAASVQHVPYRNGLVEVASAPPCFSIGMTAGQLTFEYNPDACGMPTRMAVAPVGMPVLARQALFQQLAQLKGPALALSADGQVAEFQE